MPSGSLPRFVVHKHDARSPHYDLRLEMEGVLRSWAVPKGLPAKPGAKALAIEVEDHPVAYGEFEGTIPAGHYGAGTVQLWDRGFYATPGTDPASAYRAGRMHLLLAGRKCRGDWSLVRFRARENTQGKKHWLAIKLRTRRGLSRIPAAPTVPRGRSVLTGRTMREIAATAGSDDQEDEDTAVRVPRFVAPMQALAVSSVPDDRPWRLEIKFDGYRALLAASGPVVTLWSRNRRQWEDGFGEIRTALRGRFPRGILLDGELVALDPEGRSRFQLLQQRQSGEGRAPLFYYAFDLLEAGGHSLLAEPIERRRAALERALAGIGDPIRLSPVFNVPSSALLQEVRVRGLEGIVAKAPGSPYEAGRRSGLWLKCRIANEQEFVIGGFTDPQGARLHFGALLLGYFEGKRLHYAGKVGTGFDAKSLSLLHRRLRPLRRAACPFDPPPGMPRAHWVRPRLVAQIRFAEWTQDGLLRQPVFLGLRADKPASAVGREGVSPQTAIPAIRASVSTSAPGRRDRRGGGCGRGLPED